MSELYSPHLNRVSRSFAFCIAQLREPLKSRVGLSYLLCRVLDTIEDASWPGREAQDTAYQEFDRALANPGAKLPKDWANQFPDVPEGERALLNDAPLLFADFHALNTEAKKVLEDAIRSMSRGMQHFSHENPKELRLGTPAEVNQYCLFVAGVVGELLARLLALETDQFRAGKTDLVGAHHFGQFLQKVNVLKDQVADEKLGRFLVPDREVVEASAARNVREAFNFLGRLPASEPEFRRFCAWSLFLGLESLRLARESQRAGRVLKLGRDALAKLLETIEPGLEDAGLLRTMFNESLKNLGWDKAIEPEAERKNRQSPEARRSNVPPSWLTNLYQGGLSPDDLNSSLHLS